jgi:hypothetical protein
MPKCPHCGNSADADFFFHNVRENDVGARHNQSVLVVCPSCDVVLGGGTAESKR